MKIRLTKDVVKAGVTYPKGRILEVSEEQWEHPPATGVLAVSENTMLIPDDGYENVHEERCEAVIHHGPGHQSKTRCNLTGPHKVHETQYGSYDQLARWRGDEVSSGYFNEPPQDPFEDEDDDDDV